MQCLNKNCDGHYEPICVKCEIPKWISVKDFIPDAYKYVLVYVKKQGTEPCPISIARNYKGVWEMMSIEDQSNAVACGDLTWGMDAKEITHWRPLPEPPNE